MAISTENIEELSLKQSSAAERLSHEKAKATEYGDRLSVIEKQYEITNSEYKKISDEVERTTEEFSAFERRDMKMREDMKHSKAQSKKLQEAVSKDVQKEAESLAESAAAESRTVGIRESIIQLTKTKAEEEVRLEEIMASLSSSTQGNSRLCAFPHSLFMRLISLNVDRSKGAGGEQTSQLSRHPAKRRRAADGEGRGSDVSSAVPEPGCHR